MSVKREFKDFGTGKWQSGKVSISAVTTAPTKASTVIADELKYSVIGDTVFVKFSYAQSDNTGAAAGASKYLFDLPLTAKLGPLSTEVVGSCMVTSGSSVQTGVVTLDTATQVALLVNDETTNADTYVSATDYDLATVGATVYQASFSYEKA